MFKSANVGSVDRMIRIVVGLALILLPQLIGPVAAWLSWGAPVVGVVLILTGLVRFCPAYTLFGIKTCKA